MLAFDRSRIVIESYQILRQDIHQPCLINPAFWISTRAGFVLVHVGFFGIAVTEQDGIQVEMYVQ